MSPGDRRIPEHTGSGTPPSTRAPDPRRGRVCLDGVRVRSFTASPQMIENPSSPTSIISWDIRQPRNCHIDFNLNGSPISHTGTLTVQPTATATYTLWGEAYGVRRSLAQLTVTVGFRPVPVKLSVTGISCSSEQDGILWSDDEPYVLCFSLNVPKLLLSSNPPRIHIENLLPRPRVVKVGPWDAVDDNGKIYPAPDNTIWDADSGSLDTVDDALFIVAVGESDNSNAEAVRGLVETLMFEKLLEHAASAVNRVDFTRRMVASMTSAVATAVNAPIGGLSTILDLDEPIDEAKVLPLAQRDLGRAFSGGESHMSLSFTGQGAAYRVYFRLRRASD